MYKDSSTLSFFLYWYFGKAHISHTFAVRSFIFNANFYQKDKVATLLIPVLQSGSSKDFSLYTLIHFFRQLNMGSFHLRNPQSTEEEKTNRVDQAVNIKK